MQGFFHSEQILFCSVLPQYLPLTIFHPLFMMLSDPWGEEDDTNIQLVTDHYRVTYSMHFVLMSLECCNNLEVYMWFCLSLCSFSKIITIISSIAPVYPES